MTAGGQPPWSLRRAEPGDAEALAACLAAAYADAAARIPDFPSMSDGIAEDIARLDVRVAETAGRVVGGLVLAPADGFLKLVNVAVHPDARGTGLGRALLQAADSVARDLGFGEMRLNTHKDMPENVRLYARLGWQETGREGVTVAMRKML